MSFDQIVVLAIVIALLVLVLGHSLLRSFFRYKEELINRTLENERGNYNGVE